VLKDGGGKYVVVSWSPPLLRYYAMEINELKTRDRKKTGKVA